MKTLKRLLTLILITTLAVGAWAERVSQEDAAAVANNFMNVSTSASGVRKAVGNKRMVLKKAAKAEENQFYVYENADGEGWVMVAANDVVQPILAYSKTGQFNVNNQPSNVKVWLGGYNKQIKFAEENNVEATEEVKTAWKKLRTAPPVTAMGNVVVAPLIKTTWDQDDPYWKYCPKKGSTNTYVGCVATAMAQVMNYWKWPDQGEGSYSYTSGMNSLSCSANFGSTTYDWANMIDHYTTYYSGASTVSVSNPTTAQKDAVATLMYHCGVAVEMDYGTSNQGGSGAQTIYPNASQTNLKCAANALWNNFRYKKSTLKCYYRSGCYGYSAVNDATWLNLLKTELNAARPIMYAGADNEGGHSFVCDGYDDQNYFHFNWGWSGYCDGYYTVNNMVPGTGGSGAGNGSYNDDQDIIIGIIPDKTDITITWSVQGNTTTTTQTTGTLVLPATTPSDCSGSSGKKFVGWTANSTITGGARPTDLFTSGSGITVTENKTYYAVYATASGSGGGGSSTITLNPATDTSFPKDGITLSVSDGTLTNGSDYRVYKGQTLTITSNVGDMTNIAFTYSSASYDGGGWASSYTPNASTWTSPTTSGEQARITQIVVTVGSGGGTSYSNYSLVCGTPCSNTPTMSFTNETVNQTTSDASYTQTVNISGKGSGQTVTYSSSDETVATVNNSGVVTLLGKVGSTTITASVLADGDYCAASASYTINVTAAPIDVTLYYNGTSASLTNQTNPYTLPTGSPYNTAMCSGDWTFVGWYGSTYSKSTTAPTCITQLTASGSAYAVYTTTETSGGGSGSTVTLDATTDTSFPKDGITLTTSNGDLATGTDYRIYKGATLTITSSVGDISSIKFTFSGSYNGGGWATSYTPNSSTWTSPACTSGNSGKQARITQIVVTIGSGGGGSSTTYYATSPDCVTPCSNTPIMSFTNETVNQTTSDASYTQAINISGKGSGQTVAYSSSDETVATVNNSGVVTLLGKVGSTTITASVLADGDYCAASASYTINVTAAPIDVTLYYNGTSASLTNQTNPYTLPTGAPYNTAMCGGDWTFAGWYGSAYTKSTDAPAYLSQLTATGSAYAVYTTTETSGGGSASTVTLDATTDTSFPKDGITLTTSSGVLDNGTDYRIYKGATLTITSTVGDISSIEFTFDGSYNGGGWETSYTPNSSSWTSPACTSGNSGKQARITQIVVTIGSGGGGSTTYYATSPDCTPTTTYTVTWKACGAVFKSETYAEGAALVLPDTAPEDNAGKSFVGWTTTEHYTGASAPALISAGSAVNANATYYAVFH